MAAAVMLSASSSSSATRGAGGSLSSSSARRVGLYRRSGNRRSVECYCERPFPIRGSEDLRLWRQGHVVGRDEEGAGRGQTVVTVKVCEALMAEYREPGQRVTVAIEEDAVRDYLSHGERWVGGMTELRDETREKRAEVLAGGATALVETGQLRDSDFDIRTDKYSIQDSRTVMEYNLNRLGDDAWYENDREKQMEENEGLRAVLGVDSLAPLPLTIGSSPETLGSRSAMKATIDFVVPHGATGVGAALLHMPLKCRILMGDVEAAPAFDMLPMKTHHSVLLFADASGMGPMRSLVDSSWWARRSTARGSIDINSHLFIGAEDEDDLPFSEYYALWGANRMEVCPVLSKPSPSWKGAKGNITDMLRARNGLPDEASNVTAVICGRSDMVDDVKSQLLELGVEGGRILTWKEEEEWLTNKTKL